ncbi:MAG: hypothetical protein JWM51_798 [Microbacteriaceae bacterium]|nr:hypothetical protein [Microbacteriaceae bacterium]
MPLIRTRPGSDNPLLFELQKATLARHKEDVLTIPTQESRRAALLREPSNQLPLATRKTRAQGAARESSVLTASAAKPKRLPVSRLSLTKRGIGALVFAWGLAVSQGLPAYADDNVQPATVIAEPQEGETQTVVVADGTAAPVTREAFSITAPPPPPPPPPKPAAAAVKKYGSNAQTGFVNVPTSAVQWPFASSPVSSRFGSRTAPCQGCSSDHKGLDFTPGAGTPVSAIADGVVRAVKSSSGGFGTHVIIDHNIGGKAVSSTYAHMQAGSVPLSEGATVSVGTIVGRVGSTGASTGAHLHLEVHVNNTPIDPFAFLSANVS